MYKVLTSDPANYFILDSLHSLPHLIEVLPVKSASVQVQSVCERVGWGVVRWCCAIRHTHKHTNTYTYKHEHTHTHHTPCPHSSHSPQSNVLNLLDYVVIKLNYIPSAELADISLILKDSQQ